MALILTFLSEHNALIIKILSIGVALSASFLLYRVVFVQSHEVVAQTASVDLTEVNKTVNEQKIEIETLKSETEVAKAELEKQRTEVYNLRQTIKEKEAEIETVKTEAELAKTAVDEIKKLDYEKHKSEVILSTADENLVFQKEIAELKRRLSDYEIIAEDISDMQKLKEENEKLKQLVGGAAVDLDSTDSKPISVESSIVEKMIEPTPAPPVTPAPEVKKQVAPVPEPVVEIEAQSTAPVENTKKKKIIVETETLDGVSEVDKSLMEKFEKQKES